MFGILRNNLQFKMILSFLLALLIPFTFLSLFQTVETERAIRNLEETQIEQHVEKSSTTIENILSQTRLDLLFLMQSQQMRTYFDENSMYQTDLAQPFVALVEDFMSQSNGKYYRICLLNNVGEEVGCFQRDGNSSVVRVPQSELTNQFDSIHFNGALSLISIPGELIPIYVSDIQRAEEFAPSVIHYTTNIQNDDGIFLGVLDLQLALDYVMSAVSTYESGREISLLDRDGDYLYRQVSDNPFGNDGQSASNISEEMPINSAQILHSVEGLIYESAENPNSIIAFHRVRLVGHTLKWIYITKTSMNMLLEPIYNSRQISIPIIGFLGFVIVVSTWWITRRFLKPISQLAIAANQIERNEPQVNLPTATTQDEVGDLVLSFARMSRRIRELVSQLENKISDLETTHQALVESETRFSQAFERAPVGICINQIETDLITDFNHNFELLTGYSADELRSTSFTKLGLWADLDSYQSALNTLILDEHIVNQEQQLRTKSGGLKDCLISLALLTIEGKQSVLVLLSDVTERKQAERALSESQIFLRQMAENFPNSYISVIERDFTVSFIGGREFINQGLNTHDFVGSSIDKILSNYDDSMLEKIKASYQLAFEGEEQSFELSLNDQYFDYRVVPILDGNRSVQRIFAVTENITARKSAELALYTSEAWLRSLLDNQTTYIIRTDLEGNLTYVNPAWINDFGFLAEKFLGQYSLESIVQLDHEKAQAAVSECLQNVGQSSQVTLRKPAPDGGVVWTLWEFVAITDESGAINEIQCVGFDITEQENARQQVLLQESALHAAANGIVIVSVDGIIQWCNPAFTQLTGYTFDEAVGNRPSILKSGEHDETFFKNLWNTVLSGHSWNGLITNRRKDGRLYIEQQTITPIYDDSNKITHFVAIKQDVTERIRSDERLKKYANQLEIVQNMASILNSTLKLTDVLVMFLSELEKLIPYYRASIFLMEGDQLRFAAQRHFPQHLDINYHTKHIGEGSLYRQIKQFQQPIKIDDVLASPDWIQLDDDSEVRSWLGVPLIFRSHLLGVLNVDHQEVAFFTDKQIQMIMVLANQAASAIENALLYNDMEQRVERRTQQLRESEMKSRALLEAIPDAVFRVRHDGLVLDCRIQPHERYYMDPSKIVGTYMQDTFVPETAELTLQMVEETLHTQQMQTYTYLLSFENGVSIHLESRMVAASEDEVVVLVRDVSQEQMMREQRERFIANAAHELKTPLAVIMMKIDLLQRKPDPERAEYHLNILSEVSQNMRQLINDLLDISRFESGQLTLNKVMSDPIELVKLIVNQLGEIAEKKGLELILKTEDPIPSIELDRLRFSQAITNLISNAINYTNEGYICVTVQRVDRHMLIYIEDTGLGIKPEYLPDIIFQPFHRGSQTSSTQGTGLGLAITKEIIELHGGVISVISTVDKGSTFTIQVPING